MGSNPQLARNLVLGTWEANGHMIQFEDFIRHWVKSNQSVTLITFAKKMFSDLLESPTWFSSTIQYQCADCGPWSPINFPFQTFSLFRPTTLERVLDRHLLSTLPMVTLDSVCLAHAPDINRRRLLEVSADLGPIASLILSDLIPGVSTSALSSFGLFGVAVSEGWAYFGDASAGVLPALFVNGSFSLDSYPFNQLGLHGEVALSVSVVPWFGSQTGQNLSPAPFQVTLQADYQTDLTPIDGITIRDVYIGVAVAPIPLLADTNVVASFEVGGTADIALPGQSTPLTVEARLTMLEGQSWILFHASANNWEHAFGVAGLTIDAIDFDAQVGGESTAIQLVATWHLDSGAGFQLYGEKSRDFLAVGLQTTNMSLADIGGFFQDIFGGLGYAMHCCKLPCSKGT